MKRVTAILLCVLMLLCTSLIACGDTKGDDDEETKKPKKTKATTIATTEAPLIQEIPSKLVPVIEVKEAILSNLNANPVVVTLDESLGTTVELKMHGWPTICKGDGDTIYAAASLRVGHVDPFGATGFFVSNDGGQTWSRARIINDTPVDDRDTGILYLGNGRILINYFTIGAESFRDGGDYEYLMDMFATKEQASAMRKKWNAMDPADPMLRSGAWLICSDDYGQTWSEPYKAPVTAPHGPTLANDGSVLFFGGGDGGIIQLHQSRDGGKTWKYRATIPTPRMPDGYHFTEAYGVQLDDGSYVVGIRCADLSLEEGDSHSLRTYISYSKDGYNFTEAVMIEGTIGATPHFLELSNGALLLTYQYRGGRQGDDALGIRARVSYDCGKTWDEEIILSELDYVGDLGYPSTVELSDGTLITAYYQQASRNEHPSFLYTKWKLLEPEE